MPVTAATSATAADTHHKPEKQIRYVMYRVYVKRLVGQQENVYTASDHPGNFVGKE